MKTNNSILLYDDHCPLCVAYTSLFVKYGLLLRENRVPFSQAPASLLNQIDVEKAKDEIPLIDPANHRVHYGFDALIHILGERFPLVERIGRLKPVNVLMKKIYKLISMNRKVVVAVKCGTGEIDCAPSFNLFYRTLFILMIIGGAWAMLPAIHYQVLSQLSFYNASYHQLQTAALLLLIINYAAAVRLPLYKAFEYLGQHAMLCLLFLLLISPLLIAGTFIDLSPALILGYGIPVCVLIIKEYVRRMRFVERFSKQVLLLSINNTSLLFFAAYLFMN